MLAAKTLPWQRFLPFRTGRGPNSTEDEQMTILITGATGNAGGAVVQSLAAQGLTGRALIRSERPLPDGIEPVYGDLNRPDSFAAALSGVTGIFLLSGYDRVEELLR